MTYYAARGQGSAGRRKRLTGRSSKRGEAPVPVDETQDFSLERTDRISYACSRELKGVYKLSPYVWWETDHFELLLRVVNHSNNPAEK